MRAPNVLLAWILVLAGGLSAEIRPSFHVDACAWKATDIVVVTEGESIDGDVEVVEVWEGSLRTGSRITAPELAAFASEKSRAVAKSWVRGDDGGLAAVTSSRMVLFLVRDQDAWLPADRRRSDMNVSMAWIEDGDVFAFVQEINPGPSQLVSLGMTERQLEEAVDAVVAVQQAFDEAVQQDDARRLASVIPSLLRRTESVQVRLFIIAALGDAGPKGAPALLEIVRDDSLLDQHDDAIRALSKAGGAAAAPEITEVLKDELAFWREAGPRLKEGWWNGDELPVDQHNLLRTHYGRTYTALSALKGMRFAGSREVVTALRELWQALPQLGRVGNDQVSRECDALLAGL